MSQTSWQLQLTQLDGGSDCVEARRSQCGDTSFRLLAECLDAIRQVDRITGRHGPPCLLLAPVFLMILFILN